MADVAVSFDSIVHHFAALPDPRHTRNRRHLLGDVLVIAVCGVIVGCDGPTSIARWARAKKDWLTEWLALPNGIRSRDCIRRVLSALQPEAFQTCFQEWIAARLVDAEKDAGPTISIDGKTMRRSHDRAAGLGPLHRVSAWATEQGLSLGQVATEEKSNEITAIPALIDQIDVKGAVVTIDAFGLPKRYRREDRRRARRLRLGGERQSAEVASGDPGVFPRAPGKRFSARLAPPTRDVREGAWP